MRLPRSYRCRVAALVRRANKRKAIDREDEAFHRDPAAGVATAVTLTSLSSAMAQSGYSRMSCDQLWYARNAIYAAKGYCFETRQAIAVFGPACFPPFGKLTSGEKRRVAEIKKWERRRGC